MTEMQNYTYQMSGARPKRPVIDWESLKNRKPAKAWLDGLKSGERVMMVNPARREAQVQTCGRRMSFGLEMRGGRQFSAKTGVALGSEGMSEFNKWRIVPMTDELRQWSEWLSWVEAARRDVQAFRYVHQLSADELEIVKMIFQKATTRGAESMSYGVSAHDLE